ncbi:hypothetical protein M3Y98_00893400 [Aphelenchoides besseyi]|nr:hypothetical protein M3Y98_00893400 [Aphelenchoides besseyi]KAI6193018.1 hypothetical protein M3Y96_00973600 [Aphelenchoides besseyi]
MSNLQIEVLIVLLSIVSLRVEGGTWLSFNSEQGLNELESPRRSISNFLPSTTEDGDLNHLLANCNRNYFSRATRSEAAKSESAKLCKALLDLTSIRR